MMSLLLVLVVIAAGFLFISFKRHDVRDIPSVAGKNVWLDKGRETKAFYHKRYGIAAKPDAIQKVDGQLEAVEYKSRYGQVFESDIVQLKAASLAARANGYAISHGVVKTSSTSKRFALPRSDAELFEQIKPFYDQVKMIKANRQAAVSSNPHQRKCHACGYSERCPDAL